VTDPTIPSRTRLESVDTLRGIIMILMALDHVRDYFGDLAANPTDLATTTVPLFFTRWITHICAPVFFLLTGTGAYLALRRMSRRELSRFLLTRGLWLILLEFTIVRFLWQFNLDYQLTMLTVLWALGWSMIVLAVLVHLPGWLVVLVGAAMIAGHHMLDGINPASFGALAPIWTVLHAPGFLVNSSGHIVFVAYVLIPWIGVTAVGFGLGPVYHWTAERRRRLLLLGGLSALLLFLLIRGLNGYGDPGSWSGQESPGRTVLAFINTSKYPPSLLFLLMTLGPALLILRALDGGTPALLRPALVFGRVPLFYYVMHIVLIHLLTVAASYLRYGEVHWMFESPALGQFPITQPPGWPAPLGVVYLIWLGVVVALYPLCRWFAGVRQRRTDFWLSYL
jgi:uncharacterized membrane protein